MNAICSRLLELGWTETDDDPSRRCFERGHLTATVYPDGQVSVFVDDIHHLADGRDLDTVLREAKRLLQETAAMYNEALEDLR